MSFLRKLFGHQAPETITPRPDPLKSERGKPLVHASYPPRHDGIPLATAQELLEVQADLLRRMKLHAAALKSDFADRFEAPVSSLATYISNIPGSKDTIYGGPGGLFRACLECAFFSYQASDGKIFTGQLGVEQRYRLEKRWRYICFLSGLMFPIGQTLEKIRVTNDAGESWLIRAESISQWALKASAEHYFVGWPREDVGPGPSVLGGALSIQIAGTASIRYLEEGSSALTTAYSEISSGIRTDFNAIAFDLVASMWERLKKNELARLPQNYGRVQFGQHNAPIIIDAMRECISKGKWVVNEAAVLADTNGVYLIWPAAAEDLLASGKISTLKGMPSSPSGLLQVMLDEKMLHTDAQQSAFVDVADSDGVLHLAVKLVKPDSCVEGYVPSDYLKSVVAKEVAKNDPLVEVDLDAKNAKRQVSVPKQAVEPEAKSVRVIPDAPPPGADPFASVSVATTPPSEGAPDVKQTDAPAPEGERKKASATALKPPIIQSQDKGSVDTNLIDQDMAKSQPQASPSSASATGNPSSAAPPAAPSSDDKPEGYVVPPEVEKQLGKSFSLMLARVIKEVQKPEYALLIISSNRDYLGIPYEAVAKAITSPTDLLMNLQKHGWLHPDPGKPRAMVHKLSVSNGGVAKAEYVTVSRVFVKKAKFPF
ncbi:TraI domain-containing protein [Comamonas thiooxydans]|uniref:TraI domain-containing protein n=1 Tax=Comamonas thiooxydans TaxID=363952 RepID=UPI0009B8F6B0|nr:TraI domain-containing protein [Comamonas thiooxydans]